MVFALVLLILARPAESDDSTGRPFGPGETLRFELKWSFIKAGEATLEVLPRTTVDGVPARHFRLTARTTSFLDRIYKVRDRIESFTDAEMTHSLHYRKHQREGKTHRNIVVTFDWDQKQAHYTNFGKARDPLTLQPGTFDPLSAFYYVRLFDPSVSRTIERPVTDGKKSVIGRATYVGRETIEVNGRTFKTFLLEPEIQHIGGVFEKSDDARIQIWITADARRIPVRIRSKVIVGSFIGELISAEGLKPLPD
jgi:hypothetical protein